LTYLLRTGSKLKPVKIQQGPTKKKFRSYGLMGTTPEDWGQITAIIKSVY
jgi:hypothetical protein